MDAAELALVRKTFENALANRRGAIGGLLDELGWKELQAAEPAVAVGELFEAQGRLGVSTDALDHVVALALSAPMPEGTAVVHPELAGWDRPPAQPAAGSTVRFEGYVLAGPERATQLLIPAPRPDGDVEAIPADLAGTEVRPIAGIDPELRLVAVRGEARRPGAAANGPGVGWNHVASAARRALAHELCALGQAMVDTAAAHVRDRHQFGRPIAAFQTVRHRLTEVSVALASARGALDAAWATGDPTIADAAKALAGRAAQLAALHCLQVTGAIGFTEEYGLAARIRRVMAVDGLYGSADHLRSRLGAQLLEAGAVPRVYSLP
ncbi:MAG: acyl-CoA dehydrogenase family protein [Actinomycetota bacterium]